MRVSGAHVNCARGAAVQFKLCRSAANVRVLPFARVYPQRTWSVPQFLSFLKTLVYLSSGSFLKLCHRVRLVA